MANNDTPGEHAVASSARPRRGYARSLRDGGIACAERLEKDDVEVAHHHYPEMIHGFFSMLTDPDIDRAWDALEAVSADLS